MKNMYGLILAGGSGTRLWPISSEYYPKQFLQLFSNKTLIQQTFLRLKKIIPIDKIYISTNRLFVDEIVLQLKEFGFCKENIIIQPADKNTGPAIAQAAKRIYDSNPDATIITCPADHLIQPVSQFITAVKTAYALAQKEYLVTFGIKPIKPSSEYGYIALDQAKIEKFDLQKPCKVKKFIEKPSLEKSSILIQEGSLWNSGIFIWRAKTILQEIRKFNNDIYQSTKQQKKYFSLESIPIDKSVLEKSQLVWVIPVYFDWQDIGSWSALYELLPKDTNNNVLNNNVVAFNCKNSLIYGTEGRVVTAIDTNDMIIVDTKDAVLVAHKNGIHNIKKARQQVTSVSRGKEVTQHPLVSIIIPTFNDHKLLERTLQSIFNQSYKNIECIVIDGGSTDETLEIIKKYQYKIEYYVTLPHSDFFERVNKGISLVNGEIINILDADDAYSDTGVIEAVVKTMEAEKTALCWGDLIYFANDRADKISMYWKSSPYQGGSFQKGWMPPFPTLFIRKSIYEKYGVFNIKLQLAADYELMLRFLEKHHIPSSYISKILITMVGKGLTLKSVYDRLRGNWESYLSWKNNGLEIHPLFLVSKNLGKIPQFMHKKIK